MPKPDHRRRGRVGPGPAPTPRTLPGPDPAPVPAGEPAGPGARPVLWAAALGGAALGLRLWDLGGKSLWFDEALSIADSGDLSRGFGSGYHPPLYYALLHAWLGLFGDAAAGVRLTAAVPGALTVGLLYLLGRRLFGHAAGLAAALLLAVASLHVEYSQEARMYALATLGVTLAGLLLSELVAREVAVPDEGRGARARWAWAAAYTAAAGAAVLSHYLAAPVVAAQVGALLLDRRRMGPVIARLAILQAPALVLAALGILALGYTRPVGVAVDFAANMGGVNQTIFDDPARQLLRLPVDLLVQVLPGFNLKWLVVAPYRAPALLLADIALVIGFVALARARAHPPLLRALALLPATLPLLVTLFMVGAGQLRFYLPAAPFVMLAAGAGLVTLRRARVGTLLLVSLLLTSSLATWWYFDPGMDKQPWRRVGELLAGQTRPGDVVLVQEPHLRLAFDRYFAPREGVVVEGFPEGSATLTPANLDFFLPPLVRGARRVWFVRGAATAANSDPQGLALRWLRSTWRPVTTLRERGYNGDVEIFLFER